jgi:predicted nucleic acid-binding protein
MAILAEPRKVYWDSCVWIALINSELNRVERCESMIALAKAGDVQIWTSSLTLAEVYKNRGASGAELPADKDSNFEAFLEQDFIVEVQVDHEIAILARRLLRTHSPLLRRCPDAIHLATAVANNLDELHTFDGINLLPLNGLVRRGDRVPLMIREPPPAIIGQQQDFFAPEQSSPEVTTKSDPKIE